MAAKLCARCGAQYATLKSATCPQCFARLVEVDEETAAELTAARVAAEQTEEYRRAKAEDDEQFKEQSFGACLSVIGIVVLTVVVAAIMIAVASHRQHARGGHNTVARGIVAASTGNDSQYPSATAPLDEVLPTTVGPYSRTAADMSMTLPGSLTRIRHGEYRNDGAGLDVTVIPTSAPTSEQDEFRLGATMASGMATTKPRPFLVFHTRYWRYAVIAEGDRPAPTGPSEFQNALLITRKR